MSTASETRLERRMERRSAQYPRIVSAKDMSPQWHNKHGLCAYCANLATHRVTVAINHLPNENETRDVCAVHAVALPDATDEPRRSAASDSI